MHKLSLDLLKKGRLKKLWMILFLSSTQVEAAPPIRISVASWDEVVQNVDGTPVSQPVTYKLYCGSGPRDYQFASFPITSLGYDLYTIPLPDGFWYCAVTASTTDGGESDYSDELSFTMNRKHPKPPKNFMIR
jgi:hypothetical protein